MHNILADQAVTTKEPLGRYVEDNGEPAWAPDGRRLAFSRETHRTTVTCNPIPNCSQKTDSATDIYTMNPDGSGIRQVTSTPFEELDPSWSPDGRMIAYFRRPAGGDDIDGEIWVMNADGSGQRRVALGANPEWSIVAGGPARPRLSVRFRRIDRRRKCLALLDGWFAEVKTTAQRFTYFTMTFFVDGKEVDNEFNTRGMGRGVDLLHLRRGRHRLRVLVVDPAVQDRISRTYTFRRC